MNNDRIERLTETLAQDLKPVRPMRNGRLWIGALVGLAVAVAYILIFYHARLPVAALMRGQWLGNPMAVLKPLMFLVLGLAALWAVSDLSRPEGRLKFRFFVPLLIIGGLVLGGFGLEWLAYGGHDFKDWLSGGVVVCYTTILCGGMVGLIVMWRFWLRRSATSQPLALGAMSGLATASLMAAAYALHCDGDAPVYLLVVYGGAVAIFTGIATLLGRRFLRW
ncbi:DUF1109 domain-containing protein [Asticcacaulis sp. EMRT-3]|uniref:DUF1109 domain-containing protein n=1 Tax=Asticcacaulis sp. EMRT-3 TaxID=3040349 RepID=UPI0024AF664D|nr:DUF1109 domain-containing protein [Asticcacaulis sp. EMRT-3]MDI7776325.1 DUF1109 domain-containing protein [Asticcacaulis sp. EMRT-3]